MWLFLLGLYLGGAIVFSSYSSTLMRDGHFQDEVDAYGKAFVAAIVLFIVATWPFQLMYEWATDQ